MPRNSTLGEPERTLGSVLCSNNDRDVGHVILKTFEYEQMEARLEAIPEAHAKTFGWILASLVDDLNVVWDDFVG